MGFDIAYATGRAGKPHALPCFDDGGSFSKTVRPIHAALWNTPGGVWGSSATGYEGRHGGSERPKAASK